MPRPLKLYIAIVVIGSALALLVTTFKVVVKDSIALGDFLPHHLAIALGIAFWLAWTLAPSALPVRSPLGPRVPVSLVPIRAGMDLRGLAVGLWLAALGTTEIRELRGELPWYGP